MLENGDYASWEFFRPLVTGWLAKIEAALSSGPRKKWKEVADECTMFYSRSAAAMWDPTYSRKFWQNVKAPKFRITINKAFELVAVFGPNLLWDTPHRTVTPKRVIEFGEEDLAALPELGQLYEALQQATAAEAARDRLVSQLMQAWLNYTPREMPEGGLESHNELSVVDALVKGRGCLWPAIYSFPSSDRTITGAFYDCPENLIIDPDFKSLGKAKWIARRHQMTHWEVERRFQLPAGSLKERATLESAWHYGELKGADDRGVSDRDAGKTNNLIVWYEIWSKMGAGSRMTGVPDQVKHHLEDVVGDYAYLCICPDCPYPLNCPTDVLRKGAPDGEVRQRFEWPLPLWTDNRWPVEVLDFYPDPEGPYPISPLSPGLGELKCLNFMVSWLAGRTYKASRTLYAVLGQYYDELKKQLDDADDQAVFPIPPGGVDDIRKIVQLIETTDVTQDSWRLVELLSNLFDKRVGLTETAYGRNEDGTQNRTAEETMAKNRAVGVRPEHMQKKVKAWQSRVGGVEAFLTWMFVKAQDAAPLLGQAGALLWQRLIENADGELIARQMQYDVAAASIRRPDRDRDVANFQQAAQMWMGPIQANGELTGNFQPLNGLMKKWAEYHDTDLSECYLPAPEPPDPEMPQLQKAQLQAEVQKTQADAAKSMAEAQANPAELKMIELALEQKGEEARLAMEMQKLRLELQAKAAELKMKLAEKQATLQMKAQEHAQDMQFKAAEGAVNLQVKREQGAQQIAMGRQNMVLQRAQGQQQLQQTKAQSAAKVQAIKAQAKAKPKPSNGRPKAAAK